MTFHPSSFLNFVVLALQFIQTEPALAGDKLGRDLSIVKVSFSSDDLDAIDPNLVDRQKPQSDALRETSTQSAKAPVSESEMALAMVQILLDRQGLSPGAINGIDSLYLQRLVALYEERSGTDLRASSTDLNGLLEKSGGAAFQFYEIQPSDLRGPFSPVIPARIQEQVSLKKLAYREPIEAIAERFHTDETFLRRLNPGADFQQAGTRLKVPNIGRYLDRWVKRIRADKRLKQVVAYDEAGDILAVYPASIGSTQTPSPSGTFSVRNKAGFPAYTLAPDNGFEEMDGNRQVVIAPGPNNPVGIAWIGLSKKTYGIHGTPEPSLIGRAESHGCIRLTNWDAMELARLVRTGIEVVID